MRISKVVSALSAVLALSWTASSISAKPPLLPSPSEPLLVPPPILEPAAIPTSNPAPEIDEEFAPELDTEPTLQPSNSISCGSTNRGALYRPAELAPAGDGFVVPEPWQSRRMRYGTDELIGLIERSAAAVSRQFPDAVLGVADLSDYDGGAIPRHRSHQAGRDVDLIFYATDTTGQRMKPDAFMPWFNRRMRASYARQPQWTRNIPVRYFDVAANWALARALMSDAFVEVERIFLSHRIKRWLLRYAREIGEPDEIMARAQRVLHRPRRGVSHNDHLHVRIICSAEDAVRGRCRDSSAGGRRRRHARVRCPSPLPRSRRAPATAGDRRPPTAPTARAAR